MSFIVIIIISLSSCVNMAIYSFSFLLSVLTLVCFSILSFFFFPNKNLLPLKKRGGKEKEKHNDPRIYICVTSFQWIQYGSVLYAVHSKTHRLTFSSCLSSHHGSINSSNMLSMILLALGSVIGDDIFWQCRDAEHGCYQCRNVVLDHMLQNALIYEYIW